jgi:putative endonuclease
MNPIVGAFWNRVLGARGERAAARYLRRQGMRILTKGYRARLGEIDLIARDGDTLVFVEVKARRHGVPAEAVTREKELRITLTALRFLRRHRILDQRCRFDIVSVVWPDDRRPPEIEHFRNAFEAVGRWQFFR